MAPDEAGQPPQAERRSSSTHDAKAEPHIVAPVFIGRLGRLTCLLRHWVGRDPRSGDAHEYTQKNVHCLASLVSQPRNAICAPGSRKRTAVPILRVLSNPQI